MSYIIKTFNKMNEETEISSKSLKVELDLLFDIFF